MSRRNCRRCADPFGKKVAVIDMMDYGMMKGDAVLDKALKMLE